MIVNNTDKFKMGPGLRIQPEITKCEAMKVA